MYLDVSAKIFPESSLRQYGLDPDDWTCVPTISDEDRYVVRSKSDPDMIFVGRKDPRTHTFQELELFSL